MAPSSPESLGPGLHTPHGFLEDPFDSTQDDLITMPKSPSPYARSSDMYSHMGTMPRLNLGKARRSLGKAKSSQEKGTPSNKTLRTAPLPNPKSPENSSTPDPGTDSSSAAGEAEQEEEEAPQDTLGAATARTDQEPMGTVSSPLMEAPSSSPAPSSSQTPSPDAAVGVETTNGDLLEKGQEHPGKSSPDSHHDGLESGSEYVKVWSNGYGFAFGIEFFLVSQENSLLSRQSPDLS
ncbi:SH2 domain-containing protein 3C [Grus japonensis]|uniref:SH2 domain-containing protein 3C n=1 Tax=Grus japonensis TaxID=30415 RepID=A0ABC9XL45_GRUJA